MTRKNSRADLALTTLFAVLSIGVTVLLLRNVEKIEHLYDKPDEKPLFYQVDTKYKFTNKDYICLAKNIFFEAGTESDIGKYAVAQVTINRMENWRWPDTICEVVHQPYQFSWTLDRSLHYKQLSGPNWDRSLNVAYHVLFNGIRLSLVDDAHFYHATYVYPRWAPKKEVVTRIENHIFYKFIDT